MSSVLKGLMSMSVSLLLLISSMTSFAFVRAQASSISGKGIRAIDYLNRNYDAEDNVAVEGNSSKEQAYVRKGAPEKKNDVKFHYFDHDDVIVLESFLEQKLDHFHSDEVGVDQETKSFGQRYFYSNRYVLDVPESEGRPSYAFLCVGGEGPPLDWSVLVDSVHCSGDMIELAKRLHDNGNGASVHMFALEHRYYGESFPEFDENDSSPDISNLVYLSSRQALADLAHFVSFMNDQIVTNYQQVSSIRARRLGQDVKFNDSVSIDKWVTFGGSYPGMLSAWARLKFPHLIDAAVSSSAPVMPTLDFFGYNDVISVDLEYDDIGGSRDCLRIIQEGHKDISEALLGPKATQEGHSKIASMFNVCNKDAFQNEMNARLFAGDGVIYIPAQANDPACSGDLCNIRKICNEISSRNYEEPVQILADISTRQNGDTCVNVDWKATLEFLRSDDAKGDRSWLWQTCTEFGFYQTCEESSNCPFSQIHNLSQDLEICQQIFNISPEEVQKYIEATIEYYGGRNIDVPRILFVNGDVDPWTAQAITEQNSSKDLDILSIPGASHHFWTHPVKETDDVWITGARDLIHTQVSEWLA